jgi:DNA-binding protein H-NS
MAKKTYKQLQQQLNQEKLQLQKEKQRARKERTHRLIQKGALLEKYFDLYETSVEDTEIFLKKLSSQVKK